MTACASTRAVPAPAPLPFLPAAAAAPRPRRVLGFDPGLHDAGAAVLEGPPGRELLLGAWWLRPAAPTSAPCPACARRRAACSHATGPALRAAMLAELRRAAGPLDAFGLAVVEGQYLPAALVRSIDPGALLDLAGIAGAVGALAAQAGAVVLQPPPRDWRGTCPKDELHRSILASLGEEERAALPRAPQTGRYLSDPLDAAGLALWGVGRLGRWQADPASFAELVEPAPPPRGRKRRPRTAGPVQAGLFFAPAPPPRGPGTGPDGEPMLLAAGDVESILEAGNLPFLPAPRRRRR